MKTFSFFVLMFFFFGAGCVHSPDPVLSPAPPVVPPPTRQVMVVSDSVKIPPIAAEMSVQSENNSVDDYGNIEVPQNATEKMKCEIADPPGAFNRAMYHFTSKLYFWLLKPVAQGYQKVASEVLWHGK